MRQLDGPFPAAAGAQNEESRRVAWVNEWVLSGLAAVGDNNKLAGSNKARTREKAC